MQVVAEVDVVAQEQLMALERRLQRVVVVSAVTADLHARRTRRDAVDERAQRAIRLEHLAGQDTRATGVVDDQPAESGLREADIVDQIVRERGRAQAGGGPLPVPGAIRAEQHAGVIAVFVAALEVAPCAEPGAKGHSDIGRVVVPVLRCPVLCMRLDAVVVPVGDEIDHAGNCIGTVHRGHAAGDHVHALDQRLGDHVCVHRAVGQRRRHTMPVVEDQVAVGAQVAQVELVRRAVAARGIGVAELVARPREDRKVVEVVGDRGRLDGLHVLRGQHRHRRGAVVAVPDDARSGDRHFLQLFRCCGLRTTGRGLRAGDAEDQNAGECQRHHADMEIHA